MGRTQGWNRYGYLQGNPLNAWDPSGYKKGQVSWYNGPDSVPPPWERQGDRTIYNDVGAFYAHLAGGFNGLSAGPEMGPRADVWNLRRDWTPTGTGTGTPPPPADPPADPPGPGPDTPFPTGTPSQSVDTAGACRQRDPFLEAQVRQDPANGMSVLFDGAYPTMTRSFDFSLGLAISGTTQYVADFRSWTVHEISNVSIGGGGRAALWLGSGRGTFWASDIDDQHWGFGGEGSINAALGVVGIGFQADGTALLPGGTFVQRGGFGLIDVGWSVAGSISRYVRGWSLGEVPLSVRQWFAEEYNKACSSSP